MSAVDFLGGEGVKFRNHVLDLELHGKKGFKSYCSFAHSHHKRVRFKVMPEHIAV